MLRLIKKFAVVRQMHDCDGIITVPKLKTHTLTVFTGGTKIMYGAIPGIMKSSYHGALPNEREFSEWLIGFI